MNLNNLNVQELSMEEKVNVEGGSIFGTVLEIMAAIVGVLLQFFK